MKRPHALTPDELRVLNETTNADGAFLPAQEYYGKLVETRQLANFLRSISTVFTLGTKTGNVTFESSLGAVVYEGESAATSDVTSQFDNLTMSSKKQVFLTKITEELMQDDRFDTGSWISSQIGRAMGQSELSAMLGGAANGPAGLKSIVTVGNSNLVTTAASGALTADELIDVIYTVPQQYRSQSVWVIHDTLAKAIRKMVIKTASIATANGSSITATPYLWEPSFQAGQPDKLLGYPVYTTNVGLDAFAASNKKVALFGDFSYHFIADRDAVSIRFLDQAFIASGQYGFRAVARHDAGWTVKSAICGLQIL
jgi:HK97 family phage major capsid protein